MCNKRTPAGNPAVTRQALAERSQRRTRSRYWRAAARSSISSTAKPSAALAAPDAGRRPVLTLADRLLATTLHQRLALPQVAIASLFTVRPETINQQLVTRRIYEVA